MARILLTHILNKFNGRSLLMMLWYESLGLIVLFDVLGPYGFDLQALPDDLRTKLSIDDDLVSSPREALSRASADCRMKYLKR